MNKERRPIGIFDSGVGGLTVFSEIRKSFPAEDIIYFGDTARVPYGPKSENTIREYSIQNARFLRSFQVKLIVVACNTSSALAMSYLLKEFSVPIIGVIEPGAEEAVRVTGNGRIGIIGTEGTVRSNAYPQAIYKLDPLIKTISKACPLFVPLVEEGWQNHPIALSIVQEYLATLIDDGIDTLVLGCTHYPILKETINKALSHKISLIDSAETVAKYLGRYIEQDTAQTGKDFFYVSDNEEKFRQIASRILNREILNLHRVKLGESWFV